MENVDLDVEVDVNVNLNATVDVEVDELALCRAGVARSAPPWSMTTSTVASTFRFRSMSTSAGRQWP